MGFSSLAALHALAVVLAFLFLSLLLSIGAEQPPYLLWAGVAAPYLFAALKRDGLSLATSALAVLYLALHDGYYD